MAEWKTQLQRAVDQLGSQSRLAAAIGCSQAKISWLLITADEISAEDALAVHRATNGVVPASKLRPDLWPTDQHIPIVPATSESEEAQA
jgi:DNA-binding transcriptional regulator YdaS (Cro superfamily)